MTSTVLAAVLAVVLAVPAGAPRTLGDALQAVGALAPIELDHSLDAPPPPARVGAKVLIGTAAALVAVGIGGMLLSGGCATRAANGGCVDRQGSDDAYPAMVVMGLGISVVGAYWWRQTDE